MTTSRSNADAFVLETRFVWGRTVQDAMNLAQDMVGWKVQGNPAPMMWDGTHGTGVAITRISHER
jgi:hypothetical protein